MALTNDQRNKILDALVEYHAKHWRGSAKQFSEKFDINGSVWNRVKNGERDNVISAEKLVTIGRLLNVNWRKAERWKIVKTGVFEYVTQQMAYCQEHSIARIFCDLADVGKTTAAKYFMLNNPSVFYIDASRCKGKYDMLREIARAIGVDDEGKKNKLINDIVSMLQCVDRPLMIIDEAGDLSYEAFLELKALWNALEGYCGWYMMGADGLEKKVTGAIRNEKVGYAEIFRRYGSDFKSVLRKLKPKQEPQMKLKQRLMAEQVAEANLPEGTDYRKFVTDGGTLSLTRIKENIQKLAILGA